MDDQAMITALQKEWDFDTGFFGLLRRGIFNLDHLGRLLATLDSISLNDKELLNRRVVALLWYMPLFMGWQREKMQEAGDMLCEFDEATNAVQVAVERLLGIP